MLDWTSAMAFRVWATAGKAISLTGMLQATVVRAVPIALAALGGILCERVGVINIAIEGMLLAGAFAGVLPRRPFAPRSLLVTTKKEAPCPP